MKPYHRPMVALIQLLILSACAIPPQYPDNRWTVKDLPLPYAAYRMQVR